MSSAKKKADAEKFQHQLLELLKDDPNRVCADCRARGPRWASWNLGVFICIRCAGMHRNLGVHIAKVKSVNLDTWTQEQVDNMLAWGNGIANEFYEYKLPSDFRRPSDDVGVEKFIRNKYDKKLYIHENFDYANSIKKHPHGGVSVKSEVKPAAVNAPVKNIPVVPLKTKSEAYVPPKIASRRPEPAKPAPKPAASEPPSLLQVSLSSTPVSAAPPVSSVQNDLVDIFGDMVSATPAPAPPAPAPAAATSTPAPAANLLQDVKEEPKQSFKDSIMSLYASAPPAQPAAQFGAVSQAQFAAVSQAQFAAVSQAQFGAVSQAQFGAVSQPNGFGAVSQANGQFGNMQGNGQFGMQSSGQFMMMQQNAGQFNMVPQQQQQQHQGQPQQQFRQQFPQQNMMGMQQQQPQQQQQQQPQQQQQFNQQMFSGNQQFGQNNGRQQQQQQQFNQFNQQAFGMQYGMNNMQMKNNMQGMPAMNGMQGMNNMQNMQYMGQQQQQFGYGNMGQINAAAQQQQFETIQRQLQQLKVGQSQQQTGWAFGSG